MIVEQSASKSTDVYFVLPISREGRPVDISRSNGRILFSREGAERVLKSLEKYFGKGVYKVFSGSVVVYSEEKSGIGLKEQGQEKGEAE